jgi:hypothetical protein
MHLLATTHENWIQAGDQQAGPRFAGIRCVVEISRHLNILERVYLAALLHGLSKGLATAAPNSALGLVHAQLLTSADPVNAVVAMTRTFQAGRPATTSIRGHSPRELLNAPSVDNTTGRR